MAFITCQNTGFHLRMAMLGPSGSGKTFTALAIACALGFERVGIIDTENKSARRYAQAFGREFMSNELHQFSPAAFIEAIKEAEQLGIEVLVIDSLSHAWMGRGGVLEMVDQAGRRSNGNSFNGWRQVTPEHNRLVDTLIQARMHLVVTMRVKTEYVVEQDAKGKAVPKKVGLAPVQRDGLEYEFDVVGELNADHDLVITKSRCSVLADAVINRPGPELAKTLRTWLDGTLPEPAATKITDQLGDIEPWLKRIQAISASGTAAELDQLRDELNVAFPASRRTKAQGEMLRKAIDTARRAIKAVPEVRRTPVAAPAPQPSQEEMELAAQETRPRLRALHDPDNH
jgi:hypothetical protein